MQSVDARKELETRVLSLEYQNSKLSDRLRSDEAAQERQEKLHSLQMMERGILLRELAQQVNEMKAHMHRESLMKKVKETDNFEQYVRVTKSRQQKNGKVKFLLFRFL